MEQELSPLETVLAEVQAALGQKLYYLAVITTLSLPDVCVSLECDPQAIWTNKTKYEAWCEKWLVPKFAHLTAADCYRLRCGIVHNGNFGRSDDRFDRIVFSISSNVRIKEMVMRNNKLNGTLLRNILTLDAVSFCQMFKEAVLEWATANWQSVNVAANLPELVRYRPEGLPPEISGMPIIG